MFPDEESKAEELEVCVPIQRVSHQQSRGQHSVPGSCDTAARSGEAGARKARLSAGDTALVWDTAGQLHVH